MGRIVWSHLGRCRKAGGGGEALDLRKIQAGGMVNDSAGQLESVAELSLSFRFSGAIAPTFAAVGVRQNEHNVGVGAPRAPIRLASRDGLSSESGTVMGNPHDYRATGGRRFRKLTGNGNPPRIGLTCLDVTVPKVIRELISQRALRREAPIDPVRKCASWNRRAGQIPRRCG